VNVTGALNPFEGLTVMVMEALAPSATLMFVDEMEA
jgi:hypothetical protein